MDKKDTIIIRLSRASDEEFHKSMYVAILNGKIIAKHYDGGSLSRKIHNQYPKVQIEYDNTLHSDMYEGFEVDKATMLKSLKAFMTQYDKFTKTVAPKHWRTTGSHFIILRAMQEDIPKFTEITDEEKERLSEWMLG